MIGRRLDKRVIEAVAHLPFRVQTKLLLAFLAIVALLVVVGAAGLQVLTGVNERTVELIRSERKIAFIPITVDPEHDTQEVLKDHAAGWEAKTAGWSFLSGPPAAVHEVVRRYGVYAAKTAEGAIDHTLLTSIIDPRGVLRVQYLGMRFDPAEFRRDLLSLVTK